MGTRDSRQTNDLELNWFTKTGKERATTTRMMALEEYRGRVGNPLTTSSINHSVVSPRIPVKLITLWLQTQLSSVKKKLFARFPSLERRTWVKTYLLHC